MLQQFLAISWTQSCSNTLYCCLCATRRYATACARHDGLLLLCGRDGNSVVSALAHSILTQPMPSVLLQPGLTSNHMGAQREPALAFCQRCPLVLLPLCALPHLLCSLSRGVWAGQTSYHLSVMPPLSALCSALLSLCSLSRGVWAGQTSYHVSSVMPPLSALCSALLCLCSLSRGRMGWPDIAMAVEWAGGRGCPLARYQHVAAFANLRPARVRGSLGARMVEDSSSIQVLYLPDSTLVFCKKYFRSYVISTSTIKVMSVIWLALCKCFCKYCTTPHTFRDFCISDCLH